MPVHIMSAGGTSKSTSDKLGCMLKITFVSVTRHENILYNLLYTIKLSALLE